MHIFSKRDGFTLIEMLVVIALIGILASIAVPNFLKAKDKAKEAETKANLHVIQVALERYATDHRGSYPTYLIGGDQRGWRECDAIENRAPGVQPPMDPLMASGYLSSYPKNPFVDDGLTDIIENTGNPDDLRYGGGDVRFGFDGTSMGNTLDDPRILWTAPSTLSNMQYTFSPDSYYAANDSHENINPFYTMGGIPDRSGINQADMQGRTTAAFWPGQFMYRATGTLLLTSELTQEEIQDQVPNVWAARIAVYDRYVLGCYGSIRTKGKDFIRMTDVNGNTINNVNGQDGGGTYTPNGLFVGIPFASPEVFGGGRKGVMPVFPYYTRKDQVINFVYGAPDGYDDGIIMIYTSEQDSSGEQY
jgi:type II secretion system protein G